MPEKFFNYRVIQDYDENGHKFYSIRGVHYSNYGQEIEGWDAEPMNLIFDDGDSVTQCLEMLKASAEKPILVVRDGKIVGKSVDTAEKTIEQL